jgi:hypothetical protein
VGISVQIFRAWAFCRILNENRRFSSQIDTLCHCRDGSVRTPTLGTLVKVARNSPFPDGLMKADDVLIPIWEQGLVAASKLLATFPVAAESNGQDVERRSEVRTAMKERFTSMELASLRSDLLQGGMIDSREAAELLQVFLMGRGYGVSPQAALDAAGRVEMAGCSLPVLQLELENLALVM